MLWCFGGFDGPKAAASTPVTGSLRPRSLKHARIINEYATLVDGEYCMPTVADVCNKPLLDSTRMMLADLG